MVNTNNDVEFATVQCDYCGESYLVEEETFNQHCDLDEMYVCSTECYLKLYGNE